MFCVIITTHTINFEKRHPSAPIPNTRHLMIISILHVRPHQDLNPQFGQMYKSDVPVRTSAPRSLRWTIDINLRHRLMQYHSCAIAVTPAYDHLCHNVQSGRCTTKFCETPRRTGSETLGCDRLSRDQASEATASCKQCRRRKSS